MRQEMLDVVRRECLGEVASALDQLTIDQSAREAIETGIAHTFDELLRAVELEPLRAHRAAAGDQVHLHPRLADRAIEAGAGSDRARDREAGTRAEGARGD